MASEKIFHQKITLEHLSGKRRSLFEIVIWKIPKSKDYPDGLRYRAWLSEDGKTIFGFDNHKPKGPHLHIGEVEVVYDFRGTERLMRDIEMMIRKEGFKYEK